QVAQEKRLAALVQARDFAASKGVLPAEATMKMEPARPSVTSGDRRDAYNRDKRLTGSQVSREFHRKKSQQTHRTEKNR
ncbi:MAG: hypothetical protein Q4D23_09945, partial [Bacteroidales bacterium]|nr:hypothetical protein [Bacteroidales bacterium]